MLFSAQAGDGIGFSLMIGLDWILFDHLGFALNGRVCDVYLLCVTDTLVR